MSYHIERNSVGPPWPAVAAGLEAQWRRTLGIDAAYSGEHEATDMYSFYDDNEPNNAHELFRELLMVASNDPAVTGIDWQYNHTDLNTMFSCFADALPGNTHVESFSLTTDGALQAGLAARFVELRQDVYEKFTTAVAQSPINRMNFPHKSWYDPSIENCEHQDIPPALLELAWTRILALQHQATLNGVRLIAANSPTASSFDPRFTRGPLTPEERTLFISLVEALPSNTHVHRLGPNDSLRDVGFAHTIQSLDEEGEEDEAAIFSSFVEAVKRSRVCDLDVAKFRCGCGRRISAMSGAHPSWTSEPHPENSSDDEDYDEDSGIHQIQELEWAARTSLMQSCVANIAVRLAETTVAYDG